MRVCAALSSGIGSRLGVIELDVQRLRGEMDHVFKRLGDRPSVSVHPPTLPCTHPLWYLRSL